MSDQDERVEYLRIYALLIAAREKQRRAKSALVKSKKKRNHLKEWRDELNTSHGTRLLLYIRICERLIGAREKVNENNIAHVAAEVIKIDLQRRMSELTTRSSRTQRRRWHGIGLTGVERQ